MPVFMRTASHSAGNLSEISIFYVFLLTLFISYCDGDKRFVPITTFKIIF